MVNVRIDQKETGWAPVDRKSLKMANGFIFMVGIASQS